MAIGRKLRERRVKELFPDAGLMRLVREALDPARRSGPVRVFTTEERRELERAMKGEPT